MTNDNSDYPNLSACFSLRTAMKHFNSILKYRKEYGAEVLWDIFPLREQLGPHSNYRVAYIIKGEYNEELILERWSRK